MMNSTHCPHANYWITNSLSLIGGDVWPTVLTMQPRDGMDHSKGGQSKEASLFISFNIASFTKPALTCLMEASQ